ncbi:MAG: transcriptional repressor [Acidimicrobiia bacterium]|nr:transcriptional repressor [Acidimicrobiia bacterium]
MRSQRVDAFLDQMRQGGLRITSSRRIITEQLLATDDHVTGPALAERVKLVAPEIDQSTVYRFLDSVAALGLTVQRHFGDGPAVHHLADDAHVHLRCSECGSVIEVPHAEFVSMAAEVARRYRFEMRPAHFAVDGTCATCTDPAH